MPVFWLQRLFSFDQADYMRDVTYFFVVRARNDVGESDNSTVFSFLTP